MLALGLVVVDVLGDLASRNPVVVIFGHFQFRLERAETRFHEGVVVAVGGSAHALKHLGSAQHRARITGGWRIDRRDRCDEPIGPAAADLGSPSATRPTSTRRSWFPPTPNRQSSREQRSISCRQVAKDAAAQRRIRDVANPAKLVDAAELGLVRDQVRTVPQDGAGCRSSGARTIWVEAARKPWVFMSFPTPARAAHFAQVGQFLRDAPRAP